MSVRSHFFLLAFILPRPPRYFLGFLPWKSFAPLPRLLWVSATLFSASFGLSCGYSLCFYSPTPVPTARLPLSPAFSRLLDLLLFLPYFSWVLPTFLLPLSICLTVASSFLYLRTLLAIGVSPLIPLSSSFLATFLIIVHFLSRNPFFTFFSLRSAHAAWLAIVPPLSTTFLHFMHWFLLYFLFLFTRMVPFLPASSLSPPRWSPPTPSLFLPPCCVSQSGGRLSLCTGALGHFSLPFSAFQFIYFPLL